MEGSRETDFIHCQVREAVTLSIAGLLELAGWCVRLSHWRTPPLCVPTPVPAWWHLTPPSSPLLPSDASLHSSLLCRDERTAEPAKGALPPDQQPEQFMWFVSLVDVRKINTLSIINGIENGSKRVLKAEWG